jgi:hypothetical protein
LGRRLPRIDLCLTGTDSKLITKLDTMPKEDIGEELNLDSDKNYFYQFLFKGEKEFYIFIF